MVQRAAAGAGGKVFFKGCVLVARKLIVHGGGEPAFDVFVNVMRSGQSLVQIRENWLQPLAHGLQGPTEDAAQRTIR